MNEVQTPVAVPAIVLRRTYDVPRQRVYDAWTTPETAAQFLSPGDVKATGVKMDVRPGGRYGITFVTADGEKMTVGGTYREVQPPQRLVMTWRWQEDEPSEEHDSLLTLEFAALGASKTELVLTHEQIKTVESRDRHEEGWTAIVNKLGEQLQG